MTNTDKKAGDIFVTRDYEKFKRLEGNRIVRGEAAAVKKSITNVGYVLSPILVNEKFEVIDGQHRLQALKDMQLPVYYMMQEGIGIEECQSMNTGQSNWGAIDYVYSYAENGNENYQRLASLLTNYKKDFGLEGVCAFTLPIRISLGRYTNEIKTGCVKLSEEKYELTKKRLESAIALGFNTLRTMNSDKKFYARTWWGAIAYAYKHPDVSVKELAKKLKENSVALGSYHEMIDQLTLFDQIYNKGKKTNKVFMATDVQLEKYLDN